MGEERSSSKGQIIIALIGALASIAVAYVTATGQARSASKSEVKNSLSELDQQAKSLGTRLSDQGQDLARIGSQTKSLDVALSKAQPAALERVMYSLWVKKNGETLPELPNWGDVVDWSRPEQEYPLEGAFDRRSGIWTCPKDATYIIMARLAVQTLSGLAVDAGIEVNGQRVTNANSSSSESRGAIVAFTSRLKRGDRVTIKGACENFPTCSLATVEPVSSLAIAQVSPN